MSDKEDKPASYEYEMRLRFSCNKRLYEDELQKVAEAISLAVKMFCTEQGYSNDTVIECDA